MGLDPDRVVLVNLRGRSNPLADETERRELAEQLRAANVEIVIVDPFSRAFTGENQNDAGQVTTFLMMLDAFTREEVGASELILTNHAGWDGERTRGSSALEDWPDALWRLVQDDQGTRYFSAFGRDVDLPEDALDFDPNTRHLTLSRSGSRRAKRQVAHHDELIAAVVQIVSLRPGLKTGEIEAELTLPRQRGDLSQALQRAVDDGTLTRENGPRNSRLYSLAKPVTPSHPEGSSPESPRDETPSQTSNPESPRVTPKAPQASAPDPLIGEGAHGATRGRSDGGAR
jgi:hypothetical protein